MNQNKKEERRRYCRILAGCDIDLLRVNLTERDPDKLHMIMAGVIVNLNEINDYLAKSYMEELEEEEEDEE